MFKPNVNLTTGGAIGVAIVVCVFLYLLLITHQSLPWSSPTPMPTSITNAIDTSTPSQQARDLIFKYYGDINNKDYPDAYALLGRQMQANQSYANYASGFSNTKNDDLTINHITQEQDGTVCLDTTLIAGQKDGSDQTYILYYITGMQDGTWKILNGSTQKIC